MATRLRTFDVKAQPGFGTVALICFFLLYLPIAVLVVYAFNAGENIAIWEGLSLRWFQSAWQNDTVQEAAFRSLSSVRYSAPRRSPFRS